MADHAVPARHCKEQDECDFNKELRGALMVVASLMATSTYQAALSPLKELEKADYTRYIAFRVLNTVCFVNSVGMMMQLMLEAVVTGDVFRVATMKVLMSINLLCFAAAFALGVSHTWKSTSYALVCPVVYFLMCMVIEFAFRRRQKQPEPQHRGGSSSIGVELRGSRPGPVF